MALTQDQRDWLTLALTPGVGTARFIRLLARFGTPSRVLRASTPEIADVLGPRLAARIREHLGVADVELQEARMSECGVDLVTMDDANYPAILAEVYDPPLLLFTRGRLIEEDAHAVAVVGTRRASSAGLKIAHKLAFDLAERGITVISGLAEGIDTAAHRGALEAGGRTIAVLGCGHDQVFPVANAELLDQLVRQGCAISPFAMGMRALRHNFPQRNRILSGLSLGVVVVEAPPGSGALITAKFAAEQGREVFAVPGIAGHANSRGPHELIRDGAKLVETVEDIIVELNLPSPMRRSPAQQASTPPKQQNLAFSERSTARGDSSRTESTPSPPSPPPQRPAPNLSPTEQNILSVLQNEGSFVDEISLTCRIPVSEALASLTMLELKGVVRQLSGKRFAPR